MNADSALLSRSFLAVHSNLFTLSLSAEGGKNKRIRKKHDKIKKATRQPLTSCKMSNSHGNGNGGTETENG